MNAATLQKPAPQAGAKGTKAPAIIVPFTRGSKEHTELFLDVSQLIDGNTHQLGPYDVPAYGYVRDILLQVDATGGVASVTVAAQEDAPWIVINEVALLDVNGAPLVGPFSGYDLFLINKYGGYRNLADPRALPTFSNTAVGASASGNFSFTLRIPVEINLRDSLGSLANQNASSTYKVRITVNSSGNIYSTAPNTTLPTVRFRAFLEAWSQPPATDLRGNNQATSPPSHGTTQYWSKYIATINSGSNTIRLPRVGNYVRELIFVFRNATPARNSSNWPDPASIYWDTRLLEQWSLTLWKMKMSERAFLTSASADASQGLDTGVFVLDFCHEFDGQLGRELRDGWLPTVQSTRLEITGSWGAAGTLAILTNDVAPAGQVFL